MSPRIRQALGIVVTAGVAFAAGRFVARVPDGTRATADHAPQTPAVPAAAPTTIVLGSGGQAQDPDELRLAVAKAVREELDRRDNDKAAAEEPRPVVRTERNTKAFTSGKALAESALAARVWTVADSQAMTEKAHELVPEDRHALYAMLARAANRDQLRVEVDGPLF